MSSPNHSSPIVHKSLDIYLKNKQKRSYLKWGSINALILSIVMLDINNKCPFAFSYWFYLEYAIAGLLSLSVLYYFMNFVYTWLTFEPIKGTLAQRKLLHFNEGDSSFVTKVPEKVEQLNTMSSPLNTSSIIGWHSTSFNEANRSQSNPMWNYNRSPVQHQQNFNNSANYSWNRMQNNLQTSFGSNVSPNQSNNNSFSSPYKTYTKDEIITDEHGLQKYLKEVAKGEANVSGTYPDVREMFDRNLTNTLWNYWNNAANLLKTSIYQLSPTTASPNKQTSGRELAGKNIGPGCSDLSVPVHLFTTISSTKLTKYVTNLRMWISATILQRLVKEFDKINSEFASRGFSDIQIGSVSFERLKKTAENHLYGNVSTLPMVIPFLQMSSNQEHLVQRIRELAKGSGINDYRWNSSNSYDSNWDEHVPTDAAIIFHLFCAYMDSQLMPLPQPGGRPFYNRYVVFADKKSLKETIEEVNSKSKCAILVTNPTKPKFNFISDDKVHSCTHDRNNLFCVIIHFLIQMKEFNSGLLDGVNLGKSGLNILGVIEN